MVRYAGVEKDTAYDIEVGLDTGFVKETCTKSGAWTQTSINEVTSSDRKRTNYTPYLIDTTARLIQKDANNLVDGVNGKGWIIFQTKAGVAISCSEIKSTD